MRAECAPIAHGDSSKHCSSHGRAALAKFLQISAAYSDLPVEAALTSQDATIGLRMAQVGHATASDQLTPRQMEIFGLVAKGLSNREICELLGISANTVKIHVAAILRSLCVTNRTEAAYIYRSLLSTHETASSTRARVADRIGRPAIAVLPFATLDEDSSDRFADGIVEDLITRLAGWRWFPVVAHASSERYGARPDNLHDVRRDLGVRYVIGGSVRRSGNRVRVNAHLLDTGTSEGLWSDSFDADSVDVFATQDEIARRVVARIAPELMELEGQNSAGTGPVELDAWRATMTGMWHLARRTKDDVALARTLFEEALRSNRDFSLAWYGLTWAHHHNLIEQWSDDPLTEIASMRETAASCLRLDPNGAHGNTVAGLVEMILGNRERAVVHLEKAAAINPSSTQALSLLGQCYGLAGRPDECIVVLEEALRLNPFGPATWVYQGVVALAHFAADRHDDAIHWSNLALLGRPEMISAHLTLAAAQVARGDIDQARATCTRLLEQRTDFVLSDHLRLIAPSAHPDYIARLTRALAIAGLS